MKNFTLGLDLGKKGKRKMKKPMNGQKRFCKMSLKSRTQAEMIFKNIICGKNVRHTQKICDNDIKLEKGVV